MKHICTLILACLLITACQSSPANIPDKQATIGAGVMQTVTAQANETIIKLAIAQTLTAMPTDIGFQPAQSPAPATPIAGQMPESTSTSTPTLTSAAAPPNSAPKIMFISVPPMGSSDDLYGKVEGVDPNMYGVAVYIRVGGGWWTKPTFAASVTPIASDGTWNCPYATGGNDTSATAIRAYLIPIGYSPPTMSGGSNLPHDLEQNAVAKVEATRQ